MQVKLFVGNLPWSVGDAELGEIFADHGEVQSARVISDRDTGRSRGFGFVEMETDDINAVIRATDGYEIGGRNLRVNQAEDKPSGGSRGGFGGGGGGSRGGFGGGGGGGGGRRDRY
jgi:RNA recognition motif-containing protein